MKKLTAIIGEVYAVNDDPGMVPVKPHAQKRFVDQHRVEKVRGLTKATDDNNVFNAANVKRPSLKDHSPAPQLPESVQVQENFSTPGVNGQGNIHDTVQNHLNLAREYSKVGEDLQHSATHHATLAGDMNVDPSLRTLHGKVEQMIRRTAELYGQLKQYHNGQMSQALGQQQQG